MLRATLKNVFAHKTRLILTAFAIIFGVGFVAGTFIFTDTIDATFSNLFDDVYEGIDVVVETDTEYNPGFAAPPPFDENVLEIVQAVPGVKAADGSVGGYSQLIDKDGEAIQPMGPPTIGGSWTDVPELQGNTELREGRAPQASGEIVIDAGTAKDNDLLVGDVVDVLVPIGRGQYEIVGIAGFGETDNIAGATLTLFTMEEAQRVLDQEGLFGTIQIAADEGVSADELTNRVNLALPAGLVANSAADESADNAEQLSEGLGFIQTVLLVFAAISVFVGAFIIQNTFRIVVAQRTRELGLLRAIGATGNQVIRMVLIEALIVAVIGSLLGIGFGFVISGGLTALMSAIGFDLPSTSQQLATRTIVAGLTVGIIVTLLSALVPAIKAARIPPIAALMDVDSEPTGSLRRRSIVGGLVLVFGVFLVLNGLFGDIIDIGPINELTSVGIGVLVVFIGVSILSVLFIEPLAKVISAPMVTGKITGRLAKQNSIRRPRRTAATASALMIGLALVGFFFILGESIKASTGAAIEEGLRADYVISVEGFAGGFPTSLAETLDAAPETAAVTPLRLGFWDKDGTDELLIGIDAETVEDTIFIGLEQGSLDALAQGGVFVLDDAADSNNWVLGDTIQMGFAATGLVEAEIVGIYTEVNVVQVSYLVSMDFYEENFSEQLDFVIAVKAADGVSLDASRMVIETATAEFPNTKLEDQVEYRQSQEAQVDTLLNLFNGLLALAVIIALLGIINTLVLSIIERTREVGLLRAVGMSRWQVRRMVLWESIIVAVIGGVFGLVLGIFFGFVLVSALGSQGVDVLAIPTGQLIVLLVFSAVVGVIAGLWPARKAAKLNILEAISYE
jgi:putative ABC transport system permease protein